jgi:hypothetical protein
MLIDEQQQGVCMRSMVFAIVLVVGCGGDGSVDIGANADNVCGEIAEVACHNLYNCCAEGEIEDFLGVSEPRTELQCRDDLERICDRRAATLQFSVDQNRVRFDSTLMNSCLESIVAPDDRCSTIVDALPWTEACMSSAWVGTVPVDGACLFAHDCAGGEDAFCAPNQKCANRPTAGQACNGSMPCASAFFCGPQGTCTARVPAGGACSSTSQCAKDLFCDTSQPAPTCIARLPGGSACSSDAGCLSGDCVPGQCAGSGFQCFTDAQCGMRCSNNPQLSCSTPASCGSGTCSVGLNTCTSQTQCVAGGGDTCVFPNQCLPGDCVGNPVCTAATFTVDYCTGALSALPLF